MLIARSRRSLGRMAIVGLLCLSMASCAWFARSPQHAVGYQRALYGQIYLLVLASSTLQLPITEALIYRQIGPRYWTLVRDQLIRQMVIGDFNTNFALWVVVSSAMLNNILYRQFHRGGLDREHDGHKL